MKADRSYGAADAGLSIAGKREALWSGGMDSKAGADAPDLHSMDSGTMVAIDDIRSTAKPSDAVRLGAHFHNRKEWTSRPPRVSSRAWLPPGLRWRSDDDDDDDDPPPCPAVIAPFPRLPPFGAAAELEAA